MPSMTKFNCLVEDVMEKKHNFQSDAFVLFLCPAASAPVVTNTVLANLTQASYTNCSSRALTVSSSAQTGGAYKWVLADLVLTATGGTVGPFRYPGIFNDTATNDELVGFWDYGQDCTLQNGEQFTMDFDGTLGVLALS